MTFTFTLNQEEYEALVALARKGTYKPDGQIDQAQAYHLDQFLKNIEKNNGAARDGVWLQWQELEHPLPPGTNFPAVWPPEMRAYVEKVGELVTKTDLETVLSTKAVNPVSVLFTRDPGATYGWTPIDQYP